MKRKILVAAAVAVLALLASCTQNNGYIGDLFGRWILEDIETENVTLPEYGHDVTWAFQSNIIQMIQVLDHSKTNVTCGGFAHEGNTLRISFPDIDHPPLPGLGIPRECTLDVVRLKGNRMTLMYRPEEGKSITYTFKRW